MPIFQKYEIGLKKFNRVIFRILFFTETVLDVAAILTPKMKIWDES